MENKPAHTYYFHVNSHAHTALSQAYRPHSSSLPGTPYLTASPGPPFCGSPPSQEAHPAILRLPSLTGGAPRHFVPPLPQMRCTPTFGASPPSQEAHPAILCLPSLTRGAPCHFVLPLPHKTHTPPFCASPPSQEAYPTILCLPLVTEGSSLGTSCVTDTASQLGCKTDLKLTLPALEKIAFLSLLLTLLTFWVQTD